ncbi:MAG: CPBP family intramembrane metalloprotease [Planctomycetota bacterium]|nr:MAG: CPBP family intramembrane metalloprotease [Planctomycetota bacterium]
MSSEAAKSSTGALLPTGAASGYLRQSRRPLVSLAFVVPLLLLYEGGVVVLGPNAVRNGADVWLRQFLDMLGFSQYFLLPGLTIALLLAWHHVVRDRWRVSALVLYGMFVECAVWGMLLVGLARIEGMAAHFALGGEPLQQTSNAVPWAVGARGAFLGRMLGYVGAGVYEEMLFRLLLLPPVAFCARQLGARPGVRVAGAILLTSLIFSAAHYVGPHGDSLDAFTFFFRFTAGAVFAVLFVYRGFGIAAGSHALYDIFVSLG